MVVFGLPGTRQKSYKRLSVLGEMLKALEIEEIMDIGSECNAPSKLHGIAVRRVGAMAARDLGNVIAQVKFGFVPHPSFCLAKSGIFAGLCAHGTIPILAESFPRETDGLRDGVHLISPRTTAAALAAGLDSYSEAAWDWYSGHRLNVHAATYARLLVHRATGTEAEECASARAAGS